MGERRQHLKLPAVAILGSAVGMLILASTTDPTDKVALSLVFFALLLVFLASSFHFLAYIRWGQLSPRGRTRIFIISSLLVVGLMLKSSGSLSMLEALVLLFIGIGLWFYSGRR